MENRYTGTEFEAYVAKYYINKKNSCAQDGKEFTLTLTEVRNMLRAKFCAYSGIALTHLNCGTVNITRYTDCTIDRIDNRLGYIKGNVKACAHGINQLKSICENPQAVVSVKNINQFSQKVLKLTKAKK